MNRRTVFFALLPAAPALAALAAAAGAKETAAPSRVIAIGGDTAEIVYALGAESRLVGRDDTCGHPEEVTSLPSVGYMRTLSPEGVLSLRPDLILLTAGAGPPSAVELLERSGVAMVRVPDGYSPEAVEEKIRNIAAALGCVDKGKALAARLNRRAEELRDALDGAETRPSVLCLINARRGSLMAAGRGTSAEAIIRLAGGENALNGFDHFKPVSAETVMAANPSALLIPSHGLEGTDAAAFAETWPELKSLPAVAAGRVIVMDSQYLLMFGPRYVDAAADLASAIHTDFTAPEGFADGAG